MAYRMLRHPRRLPPPPLRSHQEQESENKKTYVFVGVHHPVASGEELPPGVFPDPLDSRAAPRNGQDSSSSPAEMESVVPEGPSSSNRRTEPDGGEEFLDDGFFADPGTSSRPQCGLATDSAWEAQPAKKQSPVPVWRSFALQFYVTCLILAMFVRPADGFRIHRTVEQAANALEQMPNLPVYRIQVEDERRNRAFCTAGRQLVTFLCALFICVWWFGGDRESTVVEHAVHSPVSDQLPQPQSRESRSQILVAVLIILISICLFVYARRRV